MNRTREENQRYSVERTRLIQERQAQELKVGGCVLEYLLRKSPELISTGVIIPLMFEAALTSSGVGAVGVAAFNVVSNAPTVNDAYNALQECSDECKQCE